MVTVPTGPLMAALSEEVELLDAGGSTVRGTLRGIVALDTLIQDQGLAVYRSTVSVEAGAVSKGDCLRIRGRTYVVQYVDDGDDYAWDRAVIV